ncbi:DUF4247 domain-containing protein [Paenibacillus campi]|uniref:DUF4247 domain-containing protein n=1 Tax=Paenibacillus campi TaxID=3106031 RepID=UPI002AFF7C72|nr:MULTISPECIES: DUF4247 domain-containing protein [unclassified Paenibacillus]
MKERMSRWTKIILALSLVVSLLSGCGFGSNNKITYPLESVSRNGNSTSYVYRAANQTVPAVAEQLADQRKPQQISAQSQERMFLVYNDELIQVQRDPAKPADTLIEVDSQQYVQQNYSSSFLQGYLTASILHSLFGSGGYGGYGSYGGGTYRGYTSQNVYPPKTQYNKPSAQEMKQAPPLTVDKSGSIFKRGSSSSSKRSGYGDNVTNRGSPSSGTINRGSGSSNQFGGFFSPSHSAPKSSFGSGKIRKRGRR